MTRRVSSSSTFSTKASHTHWTWSNACRHSHTHRNDARRRLSYAYHMPSTKPHQRRCDFVLGVFSSPYHHMLNMKRRPLALPHTKRCPSAPFLHLTTYQAQTTHPHWCRFVVDIFSPSSHTCPTTCRHEITPAWCDFVFGVFSSSSHTCRTRTTPLFMVDVFSLSSTHALTHAEHETTPSRVWFRVQRLFFALPHMLTTKQHVVSWSASSLCLPHMPNTKQHHPWCCFMLRSSPTPSNELQGVFIKYFIYY